MRGEVLVVGISGHIERCASISPFPSKDIPLLADLYRCILCPDSVFTVLYGPALGNEKEFG